MSLVRRYWRPGCARQLLEKNNMSDIATIRRFLSLVKQPKEIIELRCDQSEGERKTRHHGFYNDHEKLARDAGDYGGDCYVTVNRLNSDLPINNELIRCRNGQCAKAKDFVRRTLLYLDADPVRQSGTPSTDEQRKAAIDLVQFIANQLPFPRPLIGSSGNGADAFWQIDLSADSTLPKRILKTIKAKFETHLVSIDTTVANLARIGRLHGTDNYKGGKAGRQSTIIDAPDILELLPEATMEAFAPLPKEQMEEARVQQLVTSWTFGKTEKEQIDNVKILLDVKCIQYTIEKNPDSRGTVCTWFRFADCVFRPGQPDGRTWIKVHPTEGVSGGCFHQKCQGKGLLEILSVFCTELAAQAAEKYNDSHRLARSYLQSRPSLVIWQRCPHVFDNGFYKEDSTESIKAELNLHIKKEFDSLGFKETPNVTNTVINNVFGAVEAVSFDREEITPIGTVSIRTRPMNIYYSEMSCYTSPVTLMAKVIALSILRRIILLWAVFRMILILMHLNR